MANGKALHVMAHAVAGLQDQWWQSVIVTHQKDDEPNDSAPSIGGSHCGANEHCAWRLLSQACGADRQGQGGDCNGAKDRRVVLQRDAIWHGLSRSMG